MEKSFYGKLPCGAKVHEYTLSNANGMKVSIIDYGAIITGIYAPKDNAKTVNLVLGYDSLEGYLKGSSYLGAVVGRVANRIASGGFSIQGNRYQLEVNNGPNHLHGGLCGFDKKLWQAQYSSSQSQQLRLALVSEEGDQGYPGHLAVEVVYTFNDNNELRIDYRGECTKAATPVNLTQHSYFNLGGAGTIGRHELQVFAQRYTPINGNGIPLGYLADVAGRPLDFRQARKLNEVLNLGDSEVQEAGGVDHNFVIDQDTSNKLAPVAILTDPDTGRRMRVFSTQPGVQVYTGNFLHQDAAASLQAFPRYGAVCLECQGFPDAVNHPDFPSVVVQPGQTYRETTLYRFEV
ncbi:aldose epimerase family protein [Gilvimarinus chinensis]|uniref:aldose epimerase family protein n=1 Tax=Gilvimarinus chinensis TaxID=396005 RepID=UPI00037110E9|nr:aldose epimerase family protein [Gilvimarinus chinensis]